MVIYPDIEVLDGRLANCQHGTSQEFVFYDQSPVEAALDFERQGAKWLHVADLDQIYDNDKNNSAIILDIIAKVGVPVQVVGGIRTMQAVHWWLERGAARVVLGTVALTDHSLVIEASNRYPGAVVVNIDTRDGYVMIDGWQQQTSFNAVDLALDLQSTGIAAVIHTDIDRFVGSPESNLALTAELGRRLSIPVISSGTVETMDDLARLTYLTNIDGAIVGRALLNKDIDLRAALRLTAHAAGGERARELPRIGALNAAGQGIRVYLSSYTSSPSTRWWNSELRRAITEDNAYIEVSIPQEDLPTGAEQLPSDPKTLQQRYRDELERADVVVAVLDEIENEAWSGFECGLAKASGKPIIGLKAMAAEDDAGSDSGSLLYTCDDVIFYEYGDDAQHTIDYLAQAICNRLLEAAPKATVRTIDPAEFDERLQQRAVW